MRRIDLVCKLCAPLAISFVDMASTSVAIWVVLGMNVLSVTAEYFCIASVGPPLTSGVCLLTCA